MADGKSRRQMADGRWLFVPIKCRKTLPSRSRQVNVRRMTDPKLPSILVVDDNHDNADIIRDYLEARGYPITVAYDGDEAMKAFVRDKPSLILLPSDGTL